jgi:hypothetical protein
LCFDWANASRSDLLLFRKAIKENWPVPPERRGPLMESAISPFHREDTPRRRKFAVAWLVLTAYQHDVEMQLRAGRSISGGSIDSRSRFDDARKAVAAVRAALASPEGREELARLREQFCQHHGDGRRLTAPNRAVEAASLAETQPMSGPTPGQPEAIEPPPPPRPAEPAAPVPPDDSEPAPAPVPPAKPPYGCPFVEVSFNPFSPQW